MSDIFSKDPTRTSTFINFISKDINRRFISLYKEIIQLIDEDMIITNIKLTRSKLKHTIFFSKVRNLILDKLKINRKNKIVNWFSKYIKQSYMKGFKMLNNELRKSSESLNNIQISESNKKTLNLFFIRDYTEIYGLSTKMANDISRVLFSGVMNGKSITQIKNQIKKVTNSTNYKFQLLARTEIVLASNMAVIDGGEEFGRLSNKKIKYRWKTILDGRERASHRARNNMVYTKKQALSLLGEPNCRCAIVPVFKNK